MRQLSRIPLALGLATVFALAPAQAQATHPSGTSTLGAVPAAVAAQSTDPQDEADRVTWGITPADTEGADGRVSFRYELDPGAQISDQVEVTNYSERTVTFELVASDGIVSTDGSFDLLPSNVPPTDVGTWLDIPDTVELEPMQSAVVPFTLTVPTDATPGDHPGGIVAVLAQISQDSDGTAVGLDARVGARVHLRVTGDVVASLALSDLNARYETSWNPFSPGTLHLDYTLNNDGNVRVGATQQVQSTGPFGLQMGADSAPPAQREILPAQSATVSLERANTWPLGPITTAITATPSVVGEDTIDALLRSTSDQIEVWAVPWPQLALLAMLVALTLTLVIRRRRRRRALAAALAQAREEGARQARDNGDTGPDNALSANDPSARTPHEGATPHHQ